MNKLSNSITNDLFAIWKAGVDGVDPQRLIRENLAFNFETQSLEIQELCLPINGIGKIVVLGAGKASGKMGVAVEDILLPHFGRSRLCGWINVPDDCVEPTEAIHLHGARPTGINEPTAESVRGTDEILNLLRNMQPNDLCIFLISGGGSALLSAPVPRISLNEKTELIRFLSTAGANIEQINTVRKQLSRVKGGGILKLCPTQNLVSLILSDVLGDPLDVIASGPTVENSTTVVDALAVLDIFLKTDHQRNGFQNVLDYLTKKRGNAEKITSFGHNIIIGNNAVAVDAAGVEAEKRGYSHAMISAQKSEGSAESVGKHLAGMLGSMICDGPNCLITGGEPTVSLPEISIRGKGGRNQQLILAALIHFLRNAPGGFDLNRPLPFAMLSGGTDGEDGPTDAAGAYFDESILRNIIHSGLDPLDFLSRCDAYDFFKKTGGLLITGPTGTNVCDIRVVVVRNEPLTI